MRSLGDTLRGIIRPRVSDDEWQRHLASCRSCQAKEARRTAVCPRCRGMGLLQVRRGFAQWDYLPCECRNESLRRAQEV